MKFKNKLKSYKFWVALSAALVILINAIGKVFNFEISPEIIDGIVMGFCGVLVVLGFVEKPKNAENKNDNDNQDKIDKNKNK